MATTMRVKKGDLVQVLAGKDRGKQGRVMEARPREGRVIVENLNVGKRQRSRVRSATPRAWAARRSTPGGIIERRRRSTSPT